MRAISLTPIIAPTPKAWIRKRPKIPPAGDGRNGLPFCFNGFA
jgi:hypothetical protein